MAKAKQKEQEQAKPPDKPEAAEREAQEQPPAQQEIPEEYFGPALPEHPAPDATKTRRTHAARLLYISQAFTGSTCQALIDYAERKGFGQATYVDGSPRGNVQTYFFDRDEHPCLNPIFDRIEELATQGAALLDLDLFADRSMIQFIQVARYQPGDHYGAHVDHDTSLRSLPQDRKLSFFVALSEGGRLDVESEAFNVGIGDAVLMPSTMFHAAPVQEEGQRYSFVAWCLGPNWR